MAPIRIAVAGVGNCCAALMQGIQYYRNRNEPVGIIHGIIGEYHVPDILLVSAFDIDRRKVGRELSEAAFTEPNKVPRELTLPSSGVNVQMGPPLDHPEGSRNLIEVAKERPVDVAQALEHDDVDILVNLISGGAEKATRFYAEAAMKAGCAFLNATPTTLASDPSWSRRSEDSGVALVGDDLLDQVGATVVHMGLLEFLHGRGVRIDESYQLDVGGGAESLNTLEKTRDLKRRIKTAAVAGSVPYEFPLVSGSTDYVDFLGNMRDSFFWFKGRYFGGSTFKMDIRLSTADASNSGAILIDAIRAVKLASDRGLKGVINQVASYGFKNPPVKMTLSEASRLFEEFIAG